MKKALLVFLAFLILLASASAEDDPFLSDFNAFAASVFGISEIIQVKPDHYTAPDFEIMRDSGSAMVFGLIEDSETVLAAACCVLRCVDNMGSMIDQYGRVMHAYFMCRSRDAGKEYRATTETGMQIFVQRFSDRLIIRIVK